MTQPRGEVREDGLPTRREMLALVAAAAGAASAGSFLTAWLEAAAPPDYAPAFFDAADYAALEAFTDILIPSDDTPGAREARCAAFIDFVLAASTEAAPETQRRWREAMRAVKEAGFHAADGPGRARVVEEMSRPEHERGAAHPAYFAYRLIKQQNAFAFYTSKEGLIQALDYKGNSYNASFPECTHPEHHAL